IVFGLSSRAEQDDSRANHPASREPALSEQSESKATCCSSLCGTCRTPLPKLRPLYRILAAREIEVYVGAGALTCPVERSSTGFVSGRRAFSRAVLTFS